MVEFAKMKRESGESRRRATLDACRLRLRPIIMTSCAFILGSAPLMVAHGAGAEMRQALGTAVFSGMLGVTLFGIFLTPVFYSTIDWLGGTRLFASKLVRRSGEAVIGALALRPARRLSARLRQVPPKPHQRPPAPREPAVRD
jgi:multidrug efflux pump